MNSAPELPEVAFQHRRLESFAYGRLSLGVLDNAIAERHIVQPAGVVLAEGAWDYREASTKPTPLYTDLHEPTFQYRAMLGNRRYAYIEHETEGQESVLGKDLYDAKVTLSSPNNMGRAVIDIVRNDWDDLSIHLRQADSRQGLASAEPRRMDRQIAKDLLSEFLHLSKDDPRKFQGLTSLEDVLTMMTHQAAGADNVRALKQDTHRSDYGFTTTSIEETVARRGNRKPTIGYKLGVLSVFHIDHDPAMSIATTLNFETRPSTPRMQANVSSHMKMPEGSYVSPANREELLRKFARKYLDPDTFFEKMEDELQLVGTARKQR